MHSKKLLSLALSLFVAESVVASPCKPPSSATSSIASTTLSKSTTTILSVPSTTDSETATETSEAEPDTTTTLATSTIATAVVDTTTTGGETSTVLIETSTASNGAATTTASETTTTAAELTTTAGAETTTAAGPFCAQTTVLANPTQIFTEEPAPDDDYGSVKLPFPVGVFGSSSSAVYVSTNGFLSLDSGSSAYDNTQLPTKSIPPVSIMPYWADFYVPSNTICGTGIAYEVHETSRGQTFTVEFYIGSFAGTAVSEHFTVSLYEDFPGLVRYVYYKTSAHGEDATVGLQNGELFSQFSDRSPGSIPDRFFIEIDTSSGVAVTTSGQL